jgi:hypothetical protein
MKPENELGVIVMFAQSTEQAGIEIINISSTFPDATISWHGTEYRVEFEYMASNFRLHQHDHRKCDVIVCWHNDYDDCVLPIIELSRPDWMETDLILPSNEARELTYWKERALRAEKKAWIFRSKLKEAIHMNNGEISNYNNNFICRICHKAFSSQAALNGHQKAHTSSNGEPKEELVEEVLKDEPHDSE